MKTKILLKFMVAGLLIAGGLWLYLFGYYRGRASEIVSIPPQAQIKSPPRLRNDGDTMAYTVDVVPANPTDRSYANTDEAVSELYGIIELLRNNDYSKHGVLFDAEAFMYELTVDNGHKVVQPWLPITPVSPPAEYDFHFPDPPPWPGDPRQSWVVSWSTPTSLVFGTFSPAVK